MIEIVELAHPEKLVAGAIVALGALINAGFAIYHKSISDRNFEFDWKNLAVTTAPTVLAAFVFGFNMDIEGPLSIMMLLSLGFSGPLAQKRILTMVKDFKK